MCAQIAYSCSSLGGGGVCFSALAFQEPKKMSFELPEMDFTLPDMSFDLPEMDFTLPEMNYALPEMDFE